MSRVKGPVGGHVRHGGWDPDAFGRIVLDRFGDATAADEGRRKGYADAARLLKVESKTVKRWATRGSYPRIRRQDDIAKALGVPVAALRGDLNALNRALGRSEGGVPPSVVLLTADAVNRTPQAWLAEARGNLTYEELSGQSGVRADRLRFAEAIPLERTFDALDRSQWFAIVADVSAATRHGIPVWLKDILFGRGGGIV